MVYVRIWYLYAPLVTITLSSASEVKEEKVQMMSCKIHTYPVQQLDWGCPAIALICSPTVKHL